MFILLKLKWDYLDVLDLYYIPKELWWYYCGKMFKNRKEVDTHMYEVCESTCHKWSSKNEVENDKEDIVVEDADLFMKKDMEIKKIMRDKENMKN